MLDFENRHIHWYMFDCTEYETGDSWTNKKGLITCKHCLDGIKKTVYCVTCQDNISVSELRRWTGDDALHYLCPGCGNDLLPVRYPEKEYDEARKE